MDRIFPFLQFLPLITFGVAGRSGGDIFERVYLAAALAAPVLVLQLGPRRRAANPLLIATNLFFLLEAAGFLAGISMIDRLQSLLREVTYFIVVLAVGSVATMISPRGFVGADGAQGRIRSASLALLLASVIALAVSWVFRGREVYAAFLPGVALFLLQQLLSHRVARSS